MKKIYLLSLVVIFSISSQAQAPYEEDWFQKNYQERVYPIAKKWCLDCHSEKTKPPWYSQVFKGFNPVAQDILKGREALLMDGAPKDWKSKTLTSQKEIFRSLWGVAHKKTMPPTLYSLPRMRRVQGDWVLGLSSTERSYIKSWSQKVNEWYDQKSFEKMIDKTLPLKDRVKELFKEKCSICHSPDSDKKNGGFSQISDLSIVRRDYVVLGEPEKSELYEQIKLVLNEKGEWEAEMPHEKPPLTPQEIKWVYDWIQEGAEY